jgi:hypothetical protein
MKKKVFETLSISPVYYYVNGAKNEFCPVSKSHLMEYVPDSTDRNYTVINGIYYHQKALSTMNNSEST